MHFTDVTASQRFRRVLSYRRQRYNVQSIFGDAIQDCFEVLRLRQQSVAIDASDLKDIAPIDHGPMKRLLARAIGDVASVSRRGGVLSLGADESAIVIQSSHPLDIPGEALAIDEGLREAAERLKIRVDMFWDQGRGPRLTLSLPSAAVLAAQREPGIA